MQLRFWLPMYPILTRRCMESPLHQQHLYYFQRPSAPDIPCMRETVARPGDGDERLDLSTGVIAACTRTTACVSSRLRPKTQRRFLEDLWKKQCFSIAVVETINILCARSFAYTTSTSGNRHCPPSLFDPSCFSSQELSPHMASTVARKTPHWWFFDEKANIVRLNVFSAEDGSQLKCWIGNGMSLACRDSNHAGGAVDVLDSSAYLIDGPYMC